MRRPLAAAAVLATGALAVAAPAARAAESLILRCGREYEAAKAAGALGGRDWTAFRKACAARLAGAPPSPPAPAVPAPVAAAPEAPLPASGPAEPGATAAAAGGAEAMHARQRQCGAEWRADAAALVAETPGLTWPRYWSRCNARIKATGR